MLSASCFVDPLQRRRSLLSQARLHPFPRAARPSNFRRPQMACLQSALYTSAAIFRRPTFDATLSCVPRSSRTLDKPALSCPPILGQSVRPNSLAHLLMGQDSCSQPAFESDTQSENQIPRCPAPTVDAPAFLRCSKKYPLADFLFRR